MPGIAGMVSMHEDAGSRPEIERMVHVMAHEPDSVRGQLVLAQHRITVGWVVHRGSFADCLPAWNEDRTVCLILAGEEYSSSERQDELRRRGHEIGGGNASTLVHLYEEQGPAFLRQLNGRFSGLLIDLRREFAILFNDRFGLGRIYIYHGQDGLYFSSEAKGLLSLFPELREFDLRGVAEFYAVGCVMQNRTLFRGVDLLPPASEWTFHFDGRVERTRYFEPSEWEHQEPLEEKTYCERLEQVLRTVVPRYCVGNLPVAISLTGGLDSRLILAWIGPNASLLPCYTFGGPYRDCWDVRLAREVAGVAGQPHATIRIREDFFADFAQLAEQTVFISDATMDVSGAVELYVNRKAREAAPVRLTGNYGSEILRSNLAFRPGTLDRSLFTPEFIRLLDEAGETYRKETMSPRLSFIAFKQVPWHHYGRFSIEQSQLTPRSPFLDNELVKLAYQVPRNTAASPQRLLMLIAAGDAKLARVRTDRSLTQRRWPVISGIAQKWQELTAKAEYAFDYGMPKSLVRIDRIARPLRLERLFLGRHKFYHFRTWYSGILRDFVRSSAQRPEPVCYRSGAARAVLEEHISGRANRTLELHRLLTMQIANDCLLGTPCHI